MAGAKLPELNPITRAVDILKYDICGEYDRGVSSHSSCNVDRPGARETIVVMARLCLLQMRWWTYCCLNLMSAGKQQRRGVGQVCTMDPTTDMFF